MRRTPAMALALVALAAGGSLAAPAPTPAGDAPQAPPATSSDLLAVAREIQNVCFASYPPELLARMSGQKGPVPEAVRSDPRLQLEYLKHEDTAAMGLFYPSLLDDLVPALQSVIRPGRRFLDLGSGDGRVVFLAAHLGADATGIEYEPTLDRLARRARGRLSGL